MKYLLAMAPFWDPYCPPLGIASLQAFLKQRGHQVAIQDYNTDRELWYHYREYFRHLLDLLPAAARWNPMRLGPDYFGRHQMAWLRLRKAPDRYRELTRLILDLDGRQNIDPRRLDVFDRVFEQIYARIETLTLQKLDEERPELVGCTLLSTTLPASIEVLRIAKRWSSEVRTVLGGPGPYMGAGADSPDTRRVLEECPWIDNVVIGEGELLLEALEQPAVPRRSLLSLRDVAALQRAGEATGLGLIRDLATLPTPDYSGLDLPHYTNLSVAVSRGCAYDCTFCYETTYWKKYRRRPMGKAIADLAELSSRHGRSHFFLCDSLANFFAGDLSAGLLAANLDIKWDAYLRADDELVDREYVAQLADGGMVRARLGLESADAGTLDLMSKRTTVDHMGTVLENLAAEGIQTSTLWIVGFPEEDEAAFQTSLDFLIEHKDVIYAADPWHFVFHPTTGTEPVFGRLVASNSFETRYGMRRLYPEEFDDALLVQYYELDLPDVVATKIDRIERMCAVLDQCGIPNPYSLREWRAANRRWRELHPRRGAAVSVAVPVSAQK
jgi:radical SAM superfamily enzyme YgiQ (UPF0313 family)